MTLGLVVALVACFGSPSDPPSVEPPPPEPSKAQPKTPRGKRSLVTLSFHDVPTQALAPDRLARFRTPVLAGSAEAEAFQTARECVETTEGRACVIGVPGHETIAVAPLSSAQGPPISLGSSGAFSVVGFNASGRHLAYALRYDNLKQAPVKVYMVDMPRLFDADSDTKNTVRILTRGEISPPGPLSDALRSRLDGEQHTNDGRRAAYCQLPLRLRAPSDAVRPAIAAYHFPCQVADSTTEGTQAVALADDSFGPTELRMIAQVLSPPSPPATP